jgi:hypothetical protein
VGGGYCVRRSACHPVLAAGVWGWEEGRKEGGGADLIGVSLNMMKGFMLMGRGSRALRYMSYLARVSVCVRGVEGGGWGELEHIFGVHFGKQFGNERGLGFSFAGGASCC